jgi:hypothetical protein
MPKRIPTAIRFAGAVVMLAVLFPPSASLAETEQSTANLPVYSPAKPRFALGVNVMQPAIYALASSFFEDSHFIPVPLEAHVSINRQWGLASTLGCFSQHDGDLKLQGLQLGLGPRFTLVGDGLRGLYGTFKLGIALRVGHDYRLDNYYRFGLTMQPEVGYSLAWGPPGLFLAFGLGIQTEVPLLESSHPTWEWSGLGKMVNYYLPVVNITLGSDI